MWFFISTMFTLQWWVSLWGVPWNEHAPTHLHVTWFIFVMLWWRWKRTFGSVFIVNSIILTAVIFTAKSYQMLHRPNRNTPIFFAVLSAAIFNQSHHFFQKASLTNGKYNLRRRFIFGHIRSELNWLENNM
jgi:hypothetical protein